MIFVTCLHCSIEFETYAGRVNRARKIGAPIYCGRKCMGLARRLTCPPTDAEKRAAKAEYDRQYRADRIEEIARKKSEWHKRNYDPIAAAVVRKLNMPRHIEYCRRPEYREKKRKYDKVYLAQKQFGEFAPVALLLRDIESEIDSRATRNEIYQANNTLNKAQTRRRAL